jgi:hypothetical protein
MTLSWQHGYYSDTSYTYGFYKEFAPNWRDWVAHGILTLKAGAEEISKKSEAFTTFCDTLLDGLAAAAVKDQSDGEQDKDVSEKSES